MLALDMDSTLITIECIDELADFAGVRRRVSAVTASAMRGEIDSARSLLRRVSLLASASPRTRWSPCTARAARAVARRADAAARRRAASAKTLLASGGFTFFTERLRERLGFDRAA